MSLTPKKLEVLQFINDFYKKNLYMPTVEEISNHRKKDSFTITSALVNEGYLEKTRYKTPRNLKLTEKAKEKLDEQNR